MPIHAPQLNRWADKDDKRAQGSQQHEMNRLAPRYCKDCESRLGPKDTDPDYCHRCLPWQRP